MSTTTPPNPEARFDRASWLILAGLAAFAALVLAVTVAVLTLPGDGWQVAFDTVPPQLSGYLGDWPTPLRVGDQVLKVNGLDVTSVFGLTQRPADLSFWHAGATAVYTIVRDDQTLDVSVELHPLRTGAFWPAVARTARDSPLEWSWGLIALVVFWYRPGSLAARQLLVAMLAQNLVSKLGWAATTIAANFAPGWLFVLHQITDNFWSWLFWPTIIWFVLSFPQPVFPLTRWPRLIPVLLYTLPMAAIALTLATGSLLPVTAALLTELAALLSALGLAIVNTYRRRANAVVRAQAAWVILGFGLSLGLLLTVYMFNIFTPVLQGKPAWIFNSLTLALPICLGIAITRYRLFDIDVIIRRTLIYALLTGLLAAGYLGSVLLLQNAFGLLTGNRRDELTTVISTLGIAAVFVPLRGAVQRLIDRRLYRRKYDAAQTLAAFAAAARDEVALDRLSQQLLATVQDTMQPQAVSLWLKPATEPAAEPLQ